MGGVLLSVSSCGGKDKGENTGFPSNFDTIGDAGRVAYVMRTSSPDSVARFVVNAALGRVPGARLDTMANATLYVFSNYNSDDQTIFAEEYERLESELTLTERMQLFKKGGSEDPQSFGLDLGLSYLSRVREQNLSAKDVEAEIAEFKKSCGADTMTYVRFVKGFTTALEYDKGKDVKKEIYNKFSKMTAE